MKSMYEFNVILYDWNRRKGVFYNVIPHFVREWNSEYNNDEREVITTFEELQRWLKHHSMYHFWSRCEYETILCPWPYNMNTIEKDMHKIDVHDQIMANLDVVTDLFGKEIGLW